jgi:hypothetical protein
MYESGGELCVCVGVGSHLEASFVFGQKLYTMGLDTFECIQKGGKKTLLKIAQVRWTDAFITFFLLYSQGLRVISVKMLSIILFLGDKNMSLFCPFLRSNALAERVQDFCALCTENINYSSWIPSVTVDEH